LIFGFALWIEIPWKPLSLFALLAIVMVYFGQKYTYYCESCGHSQQQLFSKSDFCSKCGKKY
jgi:nonstructural protein NSm